MDKVELAMQEILSYIGSIPSVSFVELDQLLENKNLLDLINDTILIGLPKYPEIVLWATQNQILAKSIDNLLFEKKITVKICDRLIYELDGKVLRFPIATQIRHYQEHHWIPVLLYLRHIQ